ncbi:aldolase/citrate lyase family protein [Pigmentiphaga soli]|uniref:Aldolase/citrate lyase family protein n=1 Tax=Pigmentiphaga soli TaxID=1007095 RepID=A0ABP8HNY3_9BURK
MTIPSEPRLENPVLRRLRAGEAALGMSVRLSRSADVARIARASGHDFIFIDTQHSIFDLETIGHIAQTAMACDIAPVVRVRGVDDPDTSLLLDNGVLGIVFPDVNTPEQARRGVETCRFAPRGRRSLAGGYPHFDFRPVPAGRLVSQLDDATLVACMIETEEGLANVEAIAAIDGVDVLHLGSTDYLSDIGKPGQFDHPALKAAQEKVIEAARRHGKFAGCGGNRDVERQVKAIQAGARFLTTQTDAGFLLAAADQWTSGVRKALGA